MIQSEWLGGAKSLSATEVKKLPPGTMIDVIGADKHGEKAVLHCEVVQYGKSKRLAFRDWTGTRETMLIRDYPNKAYIKA
jgi:hypothetical protein